MAKGRTHQLATVGLLALEGAALALPGSPKIELGCIMAGTALGLVITPDLDIDRGSVSLATLRRIWIVGPLLALAWRIIWQPYAWLVPHRHWLSHAPLISTALRLIYLGVILALLGLPAWVLPAAWLGLLFAGLAMSDVVHWLMDM